MKFSILIPSHNNENTIKKCIQSALEVHFDDYEIIVSDTSNKSTTIEYLEKINSSRIKYFHNDTNWSMWENHNFCMSKANGDYFVFLHTDDELLPDALTILDGNLKKLSFPDRIIMCAKSLYHDFTDSLPQKRLDVNKIIAGEEGICCFLNGGLTPSGTCLSRSFYSLVGGYYNIQVSPVNSDCLSMLKAVFYGFKVFFINDILFLRQTNGTPFDFNSKELSKSIYKNTIEYFSEDQLLIILNLSIKYQKLLVARYLIYNKKYRNILYKGLKNQLLREPLRAAWRLLNLRRFERKYI